MPRYIAIYKGYDNTVGLQQGKDYYLISQKNTSNQISVTILDSKGSAAGSMVYSSDWEFLKDWHILRTWSGRK
jgi:hypothetical protein